MQDRVSESASELFPDDLPLTGLAEMQISHALFKLGVLAFEVAQAAQFSHAQAAECVF